jgi:hypothetical protein
MKTTKNNFAKPSSKTIVAIKVMAFLSWLIYIGIAFANNMMIEAFIFSVGLVFIGYLIIGRTTQKKQQLSSTNNYSQAIKEHSSSHNYLSVFFHSNHQVDHIKTMK